MSEWQPQQYEPRRHQQRMSAAQQQTPWPPQAHYPPQAQYPPQSYGQQPQYQQPGWQGYPPQQPPRRKRRLGPKIFGAVVGLVVAIIVVIIAVAASNAGHTIATSGTSAGGKSAPKTAVVGSAITLAGNDSGELMGVTVVKVIASAAEDDGLSLTPAGDRLYAVQFRLADTGTAAYSDSPSNGAAVVDSKGQSYQSAEETVTGCTSFPATENIAPRASGLGCVVFEVPKSATITAVQFTLDSGFGPQTGQWDVNG